MNLGWRVGERGGAWGRTFYQKKWASKQFLQCSTDLLRLCAQPPCFPCLCTTWSSICWSANRHRCRLRQHGAMSLNPLHDYSKWSGDLPVWVGDLHSPILYFTTDEMSCLILYIIRAVTHYFLNNFLIPFIVVEINCFFRHFDAHEMDNETIYFLLTFTVALIHCFFDYFGDNEMCN